MELSTSTTTDASPSAKRRIPWRIIYDRSLPYLLIAPTFILVLMFTILPATRTVVDSMYEPGRNRRDPAEYVGIQNYEDLFDESHFIGQDFVKILGNTLKFTIATVIFSLPLALLMALLLNRQVFGRAFWRFSIFYPSLLPLIGAASIWAFLFANTTGLLNAILRSFGLDGVNWLGDPDVVLTSVIVVNIWKQAGYYMIFYLAGIQGIPKDIYESAELAGASMWQQFYFLTLPLLRRTTLFILVIAFIFGFQTVEQLAVLNQGNPANRANLLLYYIFQSIGSRRSQGYINAMTVVLVVILLAFTLTNFYFFERGEEDDQS